MSIKSQAGTDESCHCCSGDQEAKLYSLRHSLAHVLAQAVLQIRPNAKLAFGPPVDTGFYYDFDLETPITPADLPDLEKRMRRIINEKQEFSTSTKTIADAVEYLKEQHQEYKVEYLEELAEKGETEVGFYQNGRFVDMCRGPHVANTGLIPCDAFCLDSIAGAYWRGDEKRKQLTRIYGLAFATKLELQTFVEKRRLAAERDHRKLGKELELFKIYDEIGPGLPLWLPNGAVIKDALEDFAKEVEFKAGYQRVHTPHITKSGLYYTSGHLPYYQEGMFPPMKMDNEEYFLKPMNCPHHHIIYATRPRSYRELPLRLAEYGTCYRYEDSGSLSGLLRVRMLNMNDAHIYCRPDQLKEEFRAVLDLHSMYYKKFRLDDYWMRLSLHDPENKKKYVDNPEAWAYSERVIKEILDGLNVRYEIGKGEAAFYGPKVDYQIKNVIGREETASTNQLDFAVPERFGLNYIGEDGKEHTPYVIHRAPLGTHERFLAFLIEHFGGAFPTWMAPLQVRLLPIAEKFADYARKLERRLSENMVRVDVDDSGESFNKRVRKAVTHKIPNILIVGGREEEQQGVTWRRYCTTEQRSVPFEEFSALIGKMIGARCMDNYADEVLPE